MLISVKQDKKNDKEVEADEEAEDVKGGRQWSRSAPSPPEEAGETGSSYLGGGTGSSYLAGGTGSSYLGSGTGSSYLGSGTGSSDLAGGTGSNYLGGGTGSSYLVSSPASRRACSSAHLHLLLVLLIRTIVQA